MQGRTPLAFPMLKLLKRWAALPRGMRWLVGIVAAVVVVVAVLALAIIWALFVPVADWLARHDVGSAKASGYATAVDSARGRLLTLGAGLFAAGALVFTARNFTLSRRTFQLTEQGQVTDRYTKAVEQLGSGNLDVRIGGIYALERIARDSARDHPTVMEVLSTFVRDHSREPLSAPADDEPVADVPKCGTRPDVQAAVTVIGRRNATQDRRPVNLAHADLTGADLRGAILARPELVGDLTTGTRGLPGLSGADLTGAILAKADLASAFLSGAIFGNAILAKADLTGAVLCDTDLTGADLSHADLRRADVRRTGLLRANLSGADLSGALLSDANLTGAILTRAKLTGVHFTHPHVADLLVPLVPGADVPGADVPDADVPDADVTRAILTKADLTDALWPADAVVPEGWQRDADSGRLERADTSSGGTSPS